jgi:hypothetical protein
VLPTAVPTAPHVDWEQDPDLEPVFNPVLGRIRILAKGGLTSTMVLHDYVLKRIAPLQEHTRMAWLYTGVNDITWLECGDESMLGEEALALAMGKLILDPSSHDFITPPASYQPLCMDQDVRTLLLVVMPSMDDVDIAPVQRGDQSCGVRIPGTGVAGGQGGAVSSPAPNKNKGMVVHAIHSDDDVPLQRRRRVAGSSGSVTDGPPLAATASLADSSVAMQAMVPGGSDGGSMKKVTDDVETSGSDSSSVPSVGAKRAVSPSGSTPPAKR